MLLAKANKWEGEAIEKKEKLAKAIHELNENLRHFELLEEAKSKLEDEVKACKHELNDAKDTFTHK